MRCLLLALIAVSGPSWAQDLRPFSGEIEFRGDWGEPARPRPYQVNLSLRGRGDQLRLVDHTRELSPTYHSQPDTYNYRLNQTIVGHKYRTRSAGSIFGGGSSTSCHYVITKMTLNDGILETRNYHVIERAAGRCPADRDVIARFRPIEQRGLDFRSGQLSSVRRFRVVDGQVTLVREPPAAAEAPATAAVSENDEDRSIAVERPSGGGSGGEAAGAAAAVEQ